MTHQMNLGTYRYIFSHHILVYNDNSSIEFIDQYGSLKFFLILSERCKPDVL